MTHDLKNDPRVEAAAKALHECFAKRLGGPVLTWEKLDQHVHKRYLKDAQAALAAADDATSKDGIREVLDPIVEAVLEEVKKANDALWVDPEKEIPPINKLLLACEYPKGPTCVAVYRSDGSEDGNFWEKLNEDGTTDDIEPPYRYRLLPSPPSTREGR